MKKKRIKKVLQNGLNRFNNLNLAAKGAILVFTCLLVAYGAISASAWTPPIGNPLENNVPAPINVGDIEQTKAGKLNVGGLGVNGNIAGLSRFSVSYPTTGVYQAAPGNIPYSRVNSDSFHTNGNNVGQLYIEGAAIDGNSQIVLGAGLAGGMSAVSVGIGKSPAAGQKLDVNGSLNATQYCINGANCISSWLTGGGSGLSGSGTANYVPKWSNGTSLTNSVITDDGTGVKLLLGGYPTLFTHRLNPEWGNAIYLGSDNGSTQGAVRIRTTYNQVGTGGYPNFSIDRSTNSQAIGSDPTALTYATSFVVDGNNGNVGIGTTNPLAKLDVQSSANSAAIYVGGAPQTSHSGVRFTTDTGDNQWIFAAGSGYSGFGGPGSLNLYGGNGLISLSNVAYPNMLVAKGGNIGIGTTNPLYKLHIVGAGSSSSTYSLVIRQAGDSVNNLYIRDDGYAWVNSNWNVASDKRLKENINYISLGLDIIGQLKPATFDYISGEKKQAGFIAQDVQNVLPNIVTSGEDGMLSMKTDSIIPYLVKAIQEQQTQIDKLKNELEALKK